MVKPAIGRRAARMMTTKRRLREAALDLFMERGFESVTAEEIAERVGVSPRTFWNYFPSKADVVLFPYRQLVDNVTLRLVSNAASPLADALVEALTGAMSEFIDGTDSAENIRKGLRLIDSEPALRTGDRAELHEIEARLLVPVYALWPNVDRLTARATLAAALAAGRTGVAVWASSDGTLNDHLRRAFAGLRTAGTALTAPTATQNT